MMKRRRQSGQGMTEYIIIVALVAIVLILAVWQYGDTLRQIIEGSEGKVGTVEGKMDGTLPTGGGNSGSGPTGPATDPNDPLGGDGTTPGNN